MKPTITRLLGEAERGDIKASGALFTALYGELHRMAKPKLARQYSPVTMSATTLLHQAYLDISQREGPSFPDRARFMGYAARVMRGLIIDHARNRRAQKRGGLFEITSLENYALEAPANPRELTEISDALDKLAQAEPSLAEVVDLKFFCGFSFAEIAAMQNLDERTVQRKWKKARIYLYRELRSDLTL